VNKIIQWIKSNNIIILISLPLLVIDIILAFLDNWKIKENYLSGIITEIIGIIITITFVNLLFNQNNEKIEKELERKKIIRICRIVDLYLPRYIMHFNQLTNHPNTIFDCKILELSNSAGSLIHDGPCSMAMNSNQNLFSKQEINIDYINFSCLYESSRLFISGGFRSNIDCFYYYEKYLLDSFKRLLTEVDFKYYKEFEKLATNFIDISITNDISDFLEYNRKIAYDTGKERKLKILEDTTILASKDFNKKQDLSNKHRNLFAYGMLKGLLNTERSILNQYILIVKELNMI
jgi:hypothetical protein